MNSHIETNLSNIVQDNSNDNPTSIVSNSVQKSAVNTNIQSDSYISRQHGIDSSFSHVSNDIPLDANDTPNFINYMQNYEYSRSPYNRTVAEKFTNDVYSKDSNVDGGSDIYTEDGNNKFKHANSYGSSSINPVYPFLSMGSSQPLIPVIQTENNGLRWIKSHNTSVIQPNIGTSLPHQVSNSTKINTANSCNTKNQHISTNGFSAKTMNYSNSGDRKDMSNAVLHSENNTVKQIQRSGNPDFVYPDNYMLQPFLINSQPVRFIPVQTPILIDSNINTGISNIPTYSPFCLTHVSPSNYVNYPSDRSKQHQQINTQDTNHHKSKSMPQFATTGTYVNQPTDLYDGNLYHENTKKPTFEVDEAAFLNPSTVTQDDSEMINSNLTQLKSVDIPNQDIITNDEMVGKNRFTVETVLEVNNNKNSLTDFTMEENGNKENQDNFQMTATNTNDENEPVMKPRSRFKKTRIQEKIERWNLDGISGFDCRVTIIPDEILQLSKSKRPDFSLKEINSSKDDKDHQYYPQPPNYHSKELQFWNNGVRKSLSTHQTPSNAQTTVDHENLCLFHAKYKNLVKESETLYSDSDPPLSCRKSPSPNPLGLYDFNSYYNENDLDSELISVNYHTHEHSHNDYPDDEDDEDGDVAEPNGADEVHRRKQRPIFVTTPRNSPRMEPPPNLVIGQQQNFIPLQFPIYNTYQQDNSVGSPCKFNYELRHHTQYGLSHQHQTHSNLSNATVAMSPASYIQLNNVVDSAAPCSPFPYTNSSTPHTTSHAASMLMVQQPCSHTVPSASGLTHPNQSPLQQHPSCQLLDIHCTSPIDDTTNLRPLETIQDPPDEFISHNNSARFMLVGSPNTPLTVSGSLLSTSPNTTHPLLLANTTTLSHIPPMSPYTLQMPPIVPSTTEAGNTANPSIPGRTAPPIRGRRPRFRQYSQGGTSAGTFYYPKNPACCTVPMCATIPPGRMTAYSFLPHRDSASSYRLSQSSSNSQDVWPTPFLLNGPSLSSTTNTNLKDIFETVDTALDNLKLSVREDIHRKFFEIEHELTKLRSRNHELTQNYLDMREKCKFLEDVLRKKSALMPNSSTKSVVNDDTDSNTETKIPNQLSVLSVSEDAKENVDEISDIKEDENDDKNDDKKVTNDSD